MVIFFDFSPTSCHLHLLPVENCDSNSRLVVDEDDNGKFRLERVNVGPVLQTGYSVDRGIRVISNIHRSLETEIILKISISKTKYILQLKEITERAMCRHLIISLSLQRSLDFELRETQV